MAKASDYGADLAAIIVAGMRELGVAPAEVAGKRILIKPNLVEPRRGAEHINTHPAVVLGAAEAFLRLGAAGVVVGEGSGHCRDALMVLEESGLGEALRGERLPFVDLNADDWEDVPNAGGASGLASFALPLTLRRADWVVSVAKMKTHHWAGVTLSMKNLFGVLPGSALRLAEERPAPGRDPPLRRGHPRHGPAALRHHRRHRRDGGGRADHGRAEVRGGAGDGARPARRGRDGGAHHGRGPGADRVPRSSPPAAEDALATRAILQRGETIAGVRNPFALVERIAAHRGIRL